MPIDTETWDGVIAPAIPADWTVTSGATTTASPAAGISPISSPNVLQCPASSIFTYAIWNTQQDGNNGNVIVSAWFNFEALGGTKQQCAVIARASTTTPNFTATDWYYGQIDLQDATVTIGSWISTANNVFATLNTPGVFTFDDWYQLYLTCSDSSFGVSITRQSDGYWLNGLATWQPGAYNSCLVGTDSGITGQGYAGLLMVSTASGKTIYTDNWELDAVTPPSPITRPLVVSYPYGYYPGQQDGGAYVSAMS